MKTKTNKPRTQNGTRTYGYYKTKLSYYVTRRKIAYEMIKQLTQEHHEKIKEYSKKIKVLSRQLSKVREREWKVRDIIKATEEFMDTDIKYENSNQKASLGRNLVYKYALERGISGNVIAEVTKCGNTIPSRQRKRFTQSLSTSPQNKALWEHFNLFMREKQLIEV